MARLPSSPTALLIKFIKASPHTGFPRSIYYSTLLAGILKCSLKSPLCTYEGYHGPSIGQFIKHLSVAFGTGHHYDCHSAARALRLE